VDVNANTVTLTGIDSFSRWTLGATGDQSLPVELTDFGVEYRSGGVLLSWTTESESENLGFIIQRKAAIGANGNSPEWSEIASYTNNQSLTGQGNTSQATDYFYTDVQVQLGATYQYRLGDVDYSGNITWHEPVEITIPVEDVKVPLEFGLKKAFPNPFNPSVMLNYNLGDADQITLKVYNIRGHLIETLVDAYQPGGAYSIIWQPRNLGAGMYIVRLQSGNQTNLQKVVFVK